VTAAVRCVSVPAAAPIGDLLALLPRPVGGLSFVTGGEGAWDGLVGWGEHASLRVTGADAAAQISRWFRDQVAALDVTDTVTIPGSGPVCFVSLGFAPTDESVAIIPQVVFGRRDGRSLVTTIGTADPALPVPQPVTAPGQVRYSDTELSTTDFMAAVEVAVGRIRAGLAAKVVLAHGLTASTEFPVDERFLLTRLAARYPSCAIFAVDGLVGASPELLMRRRGRSVSSRVLAGTAWPERGLAADGVMPGGSSGSAAGGSYGAAARGSGDAVPVGGDGNAGASVGADNTAASVGARDAAAADSAGMHRVAADLMASAKDLAEHRFAAESVARALEPLTSTLDVPPAPSVLELANLTHLATDISGELAADAETAPTALDLAALLHPTAAVGGTPTAVATEMIAELERAPRARYAAPVGWLDTRGDGDFAIALRCAAVAGRSVTMTAGCGIVAESDPVTEAREAQIKMLPIRDALEG
jgi:menaquinone-specific isochorismate synthase